MKKFNETYNNKFNIKDIDIDIQEKFNNLNGQTINECCCDCCCGEPKCCSTELCTSCDNSSFPIKFYSEKSISDMLTKKITVMNMFDIHNQFDMLAYRNYEAIQMLNNSPLFFAELNSTTAMSTMPEAFSAAMTNMRKYQNSKAFNLFIKTLVKKYTFNSPIVFCEGDGSISLYLVKNTGTNGAEGSIKNSFREIYELMNELESYEEITHTNCLDVSIDNCDDVYSFVIRVNLDKMFILNTIRES